MTASTSDLHDTADVDQRTATRVTSPDGTQIAYWTTGDGPPLVLVHGGTADHTRWATVTPLLGTEVTVHAVDRRGRGASGDADEYDIRREFEDIAAVVDAIAYDTGGPVDLLGHSFGGLCALEGARHTDNVRRLLLYEPAGASPDDPIPADLIERLEGLLAAGDREAVLTTVFREAVQMPDEELAMFRSLPAWQARLEAAHTIVRELRAIETHRYDPASIATVTVPTLVLAGSDSPRADRRICELIDNALPDSRIRVMAGQQHIAMDTAPRLFVHAVRDFLERTP